tara:strand:- start:294 stop:596 length:303 start_codon:yes stop_codon:yes gene_type:complete
MSLEEPKDGPLLRMAVEGMTSHHPDKDGAGYQCNRNMLLQDVYDTCRSILCGGPQTTFPLEPIDRQMALVGQLADKEDVPFDLMWAVWVRMNEKAGKLNV